MSWVDFFVGLGAAFLSSLGFGGGTLLLLYLTLFQQVSQLERDVYKRQVHHWPIVVREQKRVEQYDFPLPGLILKRTLRCV